MTTPAAVRTIHINCDATEKYLVKACFRSISRMADSTIAWLVWMP